MELFTNHDNRYLPEPEALALLAHYGISLPRFAFVQELEEAENAAKCIGFPVVLKIVSRDIIHKSDVGGVIMDIASIQELKTSYFNLLQDIQTLRPEAQIEGVLVVQQVPKGLECIVGILKDEQFGPVVMFGIGGILMELLDDVSFAVLPVDAKEIYEMVASIKGNKLLKGYRGSKPVDIEAIEKLIATVAQISLENPQIIEMEINPFIVYEKGVQPVDVRILIERKDKT